MGFRQREKKRRKRVAVVAAQHESRRTGSSAGRWWLTIVQRATCCARCGGMLREGRAMVYRHTPREALCEACAERDPAIRWRPSRQWEEGRARLVPRT